MDSPGSTAGVHRVLVPEPRPTSDVPYHYDRAPGQKFLVLADSVVRGSPIYVAARRVDFVPVDQPRWLDPHRHDCNSLYVFLGDGPGLGGLRGAATIGDLTFAIESPSTVLIPPYALHHYWMTQGSGWYFQVTLRPEYTASLVPLGETGPRAAKPVRRDSVYAEARHDDHGWTFVDPGLFAEPGVLIDVAELPGQFLPAPAVAPDQVVLDILTGRAGDGVDARLECHDPADVSGLLAGTFHVGDAIRFRWSGGRGFQVRVQPADTWQGQGNGGDR